MTGTKQGSGGFGCISHARSMMGRIRFLDLWTIGIEL